MDEIWLRRAPRPRVSEDAARHRRGDRGGGGLDGRGRVLSYTRTRTPRGRGRLDDRRRSAGERSAASRHGGETEYHHADRPRSSKRSAALSVKLPHLTVVSGPTRTRRNYTQLRGKRAQERSSRRPTYAPTANIFHQYVIACRDESRASRNLKANGSDEITTRPSTYKSVSATAATAPATPESRRRLETLASMFPE